MKRILIAFLGISMAACSNPESKESTDSQNDTKIGKEAPKENNRDAPGDAMREPAKEMAKEVKITVKTPGESMQEMRYEPKQLEVAAGAKVTLTLENVADSEGMIHNWVLIKLGNQDKVLKMALKVTPDENYLPETPLILAATGLAQPGETQTVTFTAPEKPGSYQFICTYPGHKDMKGLMIVK